MAALFCPALLAAQPASPPTVRLSAQLDASGTGTRFEPLSPIQEPEPASVLEGGDEIGNGAFEYKVDTSQIRWAVDCGCYRYYAIVLRARHTGVVTRHKFRAYPSGSFPDRFADVRMEIRYGPADDAVASTQISLPVASAPSLEPTPLLGVGPITVPVEVSLGGSTPIELAVKNNASGMPVLLTADIDVRPAKVKLWKNLRANPPGGRVPFTLGPGAVQTLKIDAEPNLWQALQASFDPTKSDKSHTELRFEVRYTNPTFGGRDLAVPVEVPILFKPSAIALFFALLSGVLLGSLVRLLASWRGPIGGWSRWSRATLTALAVGVILEVLGALMVYNNSKLVVFGFNLDPFQTLPVLALGIGTGLLGFEAARKLNFIRDPKQGEGT